MSKESTASASASGIGFTGLLAIVFITLKLLGKITWSWWWVLSPLWGGAALVVAITVLVLLVALAAAGIEEWRIRAHRKRLARERGW